MTSSLLKPEMGLLLGAGPQGAFDDSRASDGQLRCYDREGTLAGSVEKCLKFLISRGEFDEKSMRMPTFSNALPECARGVKSLEGFQKLLREDGVKSCTLSWRDSCQGS